MRRAILAGILILVLIVAVYVVGGTMVMHRLQSSFASIKPGMSLAAVRSAMHGFREAPSSVGELDPAYCTPPADARAKVMRYDLWGLGRLGLSIHVVFDRKDRVVGAIDTYE